MTTALLLLISVIQGGVLAQTEAWTPPIGIPVPTFGVEETYRMYDEESDRNPELIYQKSSGAGYFTHYIDNTDPNATDTNNIYGSIAEPRLTIPPNVVEGSVVEIHGGPYSHKITSHLRIGGTGTLAKPIFYRGVDSENPVRISVSAQSGYVYTATYIILENISFYSYIISPGSETYSSYIVVRNCEITGDETSGGMIIRGNTEFWAEGVVIYNNEIHDNGPWNTEEGDPDVHGIGIVDHVRNLWVLENTIYHNAGNGIQLTGAGPSGNNTLAHHIYMGRNTNAGLPNLQSFIAIKGSSDVIVSQNHVWNQGGYRTKAAMGFQYGPERVWFLFNHIHNINGGIGCGSNSVPNPGQDSYFIGNLIYNIAQKDDEPWEENSGWSQSAMKIIGGVNRHIIGNTIYNADAGIYSAGNGTFYIHDNIISEVIQPEGRHIFIESKANTPDSLFYNNLFYQSNDDVRLKWGDYSGNVAEFEALTDSAQNNIDTNPLFIDSTNGDFNLQPASPFSNAEASEKAQTIFYRFYELYGIDITGGQIDTTVVYTSSSSSSINTNQLTAAPETETDVSNNDGSNSTDLNSQTSSTLETKTAESDIESSPKQKKIILPGIQDRKIKIQNIFYRFDGPYDSDIRGRVKEEYFE